MVGENEWNVINGCAEPARPITPIKAHTLNIINIEAEKKQGNEAKSGKDNLMYKVYAENKGYMYSLGNYTFSNIIPFYPKSTGQYRLIVMVKDVQSGAEEDRCEILIDVE